MKKVLLCLIFLANSIACQAITVAKSPILFQGMDDVPLEKICAIDAIRSNQDTLSKCRPRITEYAGQLLIFKAKESEYYNSYVEYDFTTQKVTSINLLMSAGAYNEVKDILEARYGKSQTIEHLEGIIWFGDLGRNSNIHLVQSESKPPQFGTQGTQEFTVLRITTPSMRKAHDLFNERIDQDKNKKKRKAFEDL